MRALLLVTAALVLVGCASESVQRTKLEFIVAMPKDEYMTDAVITPPPALEVYAAEEDPVKKEALLFVWGQSLTASLGEVNLRLKAMRQDAASARAVYESPVRE